jgi:hypothetical protein
LNYSTKLLQNQLFFHLFLIFKQKTFPLFSASPRDKHISRVRAHIILNKIFRLLRLICIKKRMIKANFGAAHLAVAQKFNSKLVATSGCVCYNTIIINAAKAIFKENFYVWNNWLYRQP